MSLPKLCVKTDFADGSGYNGTDCKAHCYGTNMVLHMTGGESWCSISPIVNLRDTGGSGGGTCKSQSGGLWLVLSDRPDVCLNLNTSEMKLCIAGTARFGDCYLQ